MCVCVQINSQTEGQSHSSSLLGDRADYVCMIASLRGWSWKACLPMTLGSSSSYMNVVLRRWSWLVKILLCTSIVQVSRETDHLLGDRDLQVSRVVSERFFGKIIHWWPWGSNFEQLLLGLTGHRAQCIYMIVLLTRLICKSCLLLTLGNILKTELIELIQ